MLCYTLNLMISSSQAHHNFRILQKKLNVLGNACFLFLLSDTTLVSVHYIKATGTVSVAHRMETG